MVTTGYAWIDLSLEALRGLDRWGASEMVDRAFAGFAALPPGSGATTPPPQPVKRWWEVFDVDLGIQGALPKEDIIAIVKNRHRTMIKLAHPDAGGSHERAAELNAALAEAEKELS